MGQGTEQKNQEQWRNVVLLGTLAEYDWSHCRIAYHSR